jgi:hypothetical protein
MPKKSSTPPVVEPLTLSIESAAERLHVPVSVVHTLIAADWLRPIKIGANLVVRTSDVADLSRHDTASLQDVGVVIRGPEAPEIFSLNDLARFFRVEKRQVHRLLKPTLGTGLVTRQVLWHLVVAGAEHQSGILTTLERRIADVKANPSPNIARKMQRHVVERDLGRCRYCSRTPKNYERCIDHVIPRSRSGGHGADNLVLACRACNSFKHDSLPHEAGMRLLKIGERTRWRPDSARRFPAPAPEAPYTELVLAIFSNI